RVEFQIRNQKWTEVLERLANLTGLPVIGPHPDGTFSYIAPTTGSNYKTIPEVVDILNEALQEKHYLLLRYETAFRLVPVDEVGKIQANIRVPRLDSIDELSKHGNSEVVSIVLNLKPLNAETFAPQATKLLSNFGQVVPLPVSNQLIVTDNTRSLRQFVKDVMAIDSGVQPQAETFSYECKNIPAIDAERVLKELLIGP